MIEKSALKYLKQMFGKDADFRDGQLEAIKAAMDCKKVLVVQKTGWGKSVVYFIATKINRDKGKGVTILISPLLSLMRNQIENARKIGIIAETINSENQDEWNNVKQKLLNRECDILLISPERLANKEFIKEIFLNIKDGIGMFVVDEAHCISDWGHDFRPDYQRIVNIIKLLPPNIPVIATTATANNRVVDDIKNQLGNDIVIQRGSLMRESLRLQVIKLKEQAERLAWLDENLNRLPGSGIVYCLTVGDANKVAKWLKYRGHDVEAYHSKLEESKRIELEQRLLKNEVKALIATVALGMGFDKPDLGFVVHYQRPGNIVSYYQQIGRAGRNLDDAYAILLCGEEDDEIQEYFIESAFPAETDMAQVLKAIEVSNGLSINEIMNYVNMSQSKINKSIKFLMLHNAIDKYGTKYIRTVNPWSPDVEKSQKVTKIRLEELDKIKEFTNTKECYMKFIASELDDNSATNCGKCTNCIGKSYFNSNVKEESVLEAIKFLKGEYMVIEPRKRWPNGWGKIERGNIPIEYRVQEGRALCVYGDSGWGKFVKEDKYINGRFRDELVQATTELIRKWGIEEKELLITAIPSLRHPNLVPDFAKRVAEKLGIPFCQCIIKIKETPEQKTMQNSNKQAENVYDCFEVICKVEGKTVILIDDMVDSRWTFTMCGYKLLKNGCKKVYPFALALTSGGDSD